MQARTLVARDRIDCTDLREEDEKGGKDTCYTMERRDWQENPRGKFAR